MDMQMDRVNIEIEDNKSFAHVASLVDKDSFIKDIKVVRTQLSLVAPYPSNFLALQKHLVELVGLSKKEGDIEPQNKLNDKGYEYVFGNIDRVLEYFRETQDFFDKDTFDMVYEKETYLIECAKAIRRRYRYAPLFDPVIFQAIVFNKVQYFKTAYATIIDEAKYTFNINENDSVKRDALLAVVITPYSTKGY